MEKLATEVTVDKKLSGLSKTTWSLKNGSAIAQGDNLNRYTAVGNYICRANSIAASLTNSPTQVAFMLHVYDVTGTEATEGYCYRYQELTDLYANKYIRYGNSSTGIANMTWHEWKQIV